VITDQQLQPILSYWSDAAVAWHRDFHDLVASGKPLDDPSDAAACLWVVMQALRERDATIAELRDRIGEHIGYATETSEDMEALKAEIAELGKPADGTLVGQLSGFLTVLASYAHISGDQGDKLRWAASLLLSLQRDLVELRKPVAVERNETVERIRAEQQLREALEFIERWSHESFPRTGRTWEDGSPMSYSAAFGSNGERDYMRGIARTALAASPAPVDSAALAQPQGEQQPIDLLQRLKELLPNGVTKESGNG
jgi:hypothetical protein